MKISDVASLAYRSVRSNKLRTGITITIIAFGIMALIGIITAIQAMNQKLTESFSTMGANGFTIRFKERNFHLIYMYIISVCRIFSHILYFHISRFEN